MFLGTFLIFFSSTSHRYSFNITFETPFIYHQSVLPKCRTFTANSSTETAVIPKGRFSTSNSGTKFAVLLGMNRCGSFPLLSALYSLYSIWTDLKRSQKIPGTPAYRWGVWIWLTWPSGLHWNSPQGFWPDRPYTHTHTHTYIYIYIYIYRGVQDNVLILW